MEQDLQNLRSIPRIIFHTNHVDELQYMQNNRTISKLINLENQPVGVYWGERYFHVLDPDGHQRSFATPLAKKPDVQ